MRLHRMTRLFCVAIVLSCSGEGVPVSVQPVDEEDYVGRGSEACQSWQSAVCDRVERCETSEPAGRDCEVHYGSFVCRSDEIAQECADAYADAGCSDPPEECGIAEVVNPKPAVEGCLALLEAYCRNFVACELPRAATQEDCLEAYGENFICDNAVGLYPWFEECLDRVPQLPCGEVFQGECSEPYVIQF